MPGGDRTGIAGRGPMTGRGLGYCAGNQFPGSAYRGFGQGYCRGAGFGFHGGQGRALKRGRYGFPFPAAQEMAPAPMPQHEKELLRDQAAYLEKTLDDIKKRIEALESEQKTE